jgi:hypothetical protein
MTALERRVRRLLTVYPPTYRSARGDEILDTIVEASSPEQTWPHWREVTSAVRHGLALRFLAWSRSGTGRGLAAAAPGGLAVAGAIALVATMFGELPIWGRDPGLNANQFGYGPFETDGVFMYAPVLLALTAYVAGHPAMARAFSGLALVATVGCCLAAHTGDVARPNAAVVGLVVTCLVPVLTVHPSTLSRTSRARRLVAGVVGAALVLGVVGWVGQPTGHPSHMDPRDVFYTGDTGLAARLQRITPAAMVVMLVVAGAAAWRASRPEWWTAATMALLPATALTYLAGRAEWSLTGAPGHAWLRYQGNHPFVETVVVAGAVLLVQGAVMAGRAVRRSLRDGEHAGPPYRS